MGNGEQIEIEGDEVIPEIMDTSALVAAERGVIDSQVATARQYPRSIKKFLDGINSQATASEEIALSCIYRLPRGGKTISGPSIRLAEILYANYGNLRLDGDIVSIGQEEVHARGTCVDLEKNLAVRTTVIRRIVDKRGNRYSGDMVAQTCNAAVSLAMRNAVLRTIPRALWEETFEAVFEVALGKAESFGELRDKAIEWLNKAGAPTPNILAALERDRLEDVTREDVLSLRTTAKQVKIGETRIDDAFPAPTPKTTADSRSAAGAKAAEAVAAAKGKKEEPAAAAGGA